MNNNYILTIGKSNSYDVKSFSSSEKLGQFYKYDIIFSQDSLIFSLENLLMEKATFTIKNQNNLLSDQDLVVHGIITKIEIIGESNDQTLLKCVLEPQVKLLDRAIKCRLFQHQLPQEIIHDILKHNNINADYYSFELQDHYSPIDYITQFNETDWNIIKRICERYGIWFRFEQNQEHEVIKFCDAPQGYHNTNKVYAYIPENGLFSSDDQNTVLSNNSSIKKYNTLLTR